MVATGSTSGRDARDLHALPKAHLHLHFTGSMRHETLVELARRDGIVLPDALVEDWPPRLSAADEKGWFRFQRLYDVARSVLRTEDDVRRLVREAAEDDVADGGRWLELQVDPSGYAARFGGITAFTDLVLDAVRETSAATGLGIAVVIAANRTRHPLDALHADRLGHGVRAVEDPALLARIVDAGIALEICPVSNVALGVYSDLTSVPLPTLLEAGATVALGADDPLLFGSRLAGQYTTMRAAHDLSDETLARLAAMSVSASCAPDEEKARLLADVNDWLSAAPRSATMSP